MAASNSDKFKKLARKWTGQIGSGGVADDSVTTIPLSSATNLPTDTAVVPTINRVDSSGTATPSKEESIVGVVSGNNLVTCIRGVEGTAQAHNAGDVVEILFTNKVWDDAMDGILVEHNQDGTHKAISITGVGVTANSIDVDAVNTSGSVISFINAGENSGQVLYVKQDHASSTGEAGKIVNDGTGDGLLINQNGDGTALNITTAATTISGAGIFVSQGSTLNNWSSTVEIKTTAEQDSLNAYLLYVTNENASSASRVMAIHNDGTGNGLYINQDGEGIALNIDSEATSASGIYLDQPVADTKFSLQIRHGGTNKFLITREDDVTNDVAMVLGTYHLWVDTTGDLRIKSGRPTSDTDGSVVGSQS